MANSSLIVTFSPPTSTPDEVLILEQEEWAKGIGVMTKLDLINYIEATFYGAPLPGLDCDVEDGTCVTAVLVYPYDPDLNYDIGVTHGELHPASIVDVEVSEVLKFNLSSEATTKYPVQEWRAYEWYDNVWDEDAVQLTASQFPDLTLTGKRDVTVPADIYGAVKVNYVTTRHVRALEISARGDVVENVYSSVAWTRWDGGVKMLVINPPAGAESDYSESVSCASRSIARFNKGDPYMPIPKVEGEDEEILIDYCTQEIIV